MVVISSEWNDGGGLKGVEGIVTVHPAHPAFFFNFFFFFSIRSKNKEVVKENIPGLQSLKGRKQ